ncbi:hypothetical protein GYH30_034891 [Glycine max]|uniref:Uncharacterized protein n=1 Tax=Glycine max TaxID=3847 RepID=A0A0R0GNX2_SOYBN|nr:hypothetical protein JHK87_034919 [Glycine soja]KAH1099461.1 hypothetical protein GYH30_034891 [Glycine max]
MDVQTKYWKELRVSNEFVKEETLKIIVGKKLKYRFPRKRQQKKPSPNCMVWLTEVYSSNTQDCNSLVPLQSKRSDYCANN